MLQKGPNLKKVCHTDSCPMQLDQTHSNHYRQQQIDHHFTFNTLDKNCIQILHNSIFNDLFL